MYVLQYNAMYVCISYFSSIHCKYVRWDYDGILKTDAAKIAVANYYYIPCIPEKLSQEVNQM